MGGRLLGLAGSRSRALTLLRGVFTKSIVGACVLAMLASGGVLAQPASKQAAAPAPVASLGGFGALNGVAAAAFRVPSDVKLVRTWRDAKRNLTYSRYQQYVQPQNAAVDGAQLTVVKRGSAVVLVIGGYYPNLRVTNRVLVSGTQAVAVAASDKKLLRNAAAADNGAKIKSRVKLWLNPSNGRLFQQVESGVTGQGFVHQVDAETGAIIDSWESTTDAGTGTGVKGDAKDLTDLTTPVAGDFQMKSTDNRVQTHNGSTTSNLNTAPLMVDSNDAWVGTGQRTGVDSQFYTALTDDWYRDQGLFDLVDDCADTADDLNWADGEELHSIVHYNYDGNRFNAFFDDIDGRFGYGDGDSITFLPFTGGQDVVSHELTHRATECRAPLEYTSWSGALNESISDIMATAIEWDTNEPTTTGCKREVGQTSCPDWWLGEDVVLDSSWAFRNLADPSVVGNPSHWDQRFNCSGEVHCNSSIPNHAFYLMVNGGRNARCSGPTDAQADCDVVVPPIPMDDAASIVFAGWGLLPNPTRQNTAAMAKQFCNAHSATVYEAALMFPGSALHTASTDLAWTAVGRGYGPDTTSPGDDCQPPSAFVVTEPAGPQPPAFAPHITPRSIVLAPNTSGSLPVTLGSAGAEPPHTLSVIDGGAATVDYVGTPNPHIQISVPNGMANGTYPILLSESNGTDTAYAGATLIVDTNPPTASVTGVSLAATGQVAANGAVPLLVSWTASDAESGIDTSELQKSSTNTFPGTTVATGSTGTTSTVSTTDAVDWFRVTTVDAAGNDADSASSGPWNVGRAQENSVGVTYLRTWSAMPSSTNFGSTRFSTKYGAWVRYEFSGTDIAFVTTRATGRGKVKIYIDGVFKKKVNLAAGTLGARQIAYRLSGLSNGSHVIRVKNVTGGKRVDVDGFITLSH